MAQRTSIYGHVITGIKAFTVLILLELGITRDIQNITLTGSGYLESDEES